MISLKLIPYLAGLGLLIWGIFYFVRVGRDKEKIKQFNKDTEAAKDDVYVEEKQAKILANRSKLNIFERLRKGKF